MSKHHTVSKSGCASCHRNHPPAAVQLPSVTICAHSGSSKCWSTSRVQCRRSYSHPYRPFSSNSSHQRVVCWAGSPGHANPTNAPGPPSSAKQQPLFSPLIPVFRQTKHDNDIRGLAIPALFSLLLDPVMSLVDCAIIGRLGSESLAATGASISIFSLAGLLVSFLSYVTVPAVAEAATSGDDAEVSRVISTGVWLAVLFGILVTGFIIGVGPFILGAMKLEAGVVVKAKGYVWARALGSIGHLLVLVGSGSFRGIQV